jgi:hypothetical protein
MSMCVFYNFLNARKSSEGPDELIHWLPLNTCMVSVNTCTHSACTDIALCGAYMNMSWVWILVSCCTMWYTHKKGACVYTHTQVPVDLQVTKFCEKYT